jgi:hypothetical protein
LGAIREKWNTEYGIGIQESEVRIQNTEYRMVPAIWKLSSALKGKGLEDSAQGFNPGNFPVKRGALKGRKGVALPNDAMLLGIPSLPPLQLQGGSIFSCMSPGLKPG